MSTGLRFTLQTGPLGLEAQENPLVGLNAEHQTVGLPVPDRRGRKGLVGHRSELDHHFGNPGRQALSRCAVEGDILPAPVVDEKPDGGKRLDRGIAGHSRLCPVGRHVLALDPAVAVLPADGALVDMIRVNGTDRVEDIGHLVADLVGVEGDRRLHGDQAEDLDEMILDHVPQGPGVVVVGPPVFDPDLLGHGDLHVVDVAPVPDRLEEGIGKAERQDVLHRLLAEVVVDPVDLGLVEEGGENLVQGPGGFQVPPEGLFHHDARARCDRGPGPPPPAGGG